MLAFKENRISAFLMDGTWEYPANVEFLSSITIESEILGKLF